jgi:phosphate transport system permease protein
MEVTGAMKGTIEDGPGRLVFSEPRLRRQRWADLAFRGFTRLFALGILGLFFGLLVTLAAGAAPAFERFGVEFLVRAEWDPVLSEFGALVPIYGTLITSCIALLVAVPLGFGIAVFLTELSPRFLRRPLGTAVELLAAVPSVIYGMWGLFVFAPFFAAHVQPVLGDTLGPLPVVGPFFQGPRIGIGLLTAGLILALMILPFIASVMRDVFESVPALLKESAYGLGATTWEVIWKVVLPYTQRGVVGGVMLGLGRALGETMAVTFVIGNAHRITHSLFMPGSTISSVLANEFAEAADKLHLSSLIALGLLLCLITFFVLALSKFLLARAESRAGGHS